MKMEKFARFVAEKFSVKTPDNALVLFSVSCQTASENKQKARSYVNDRPERRKRLEDTACGKRLIELGLENPSCSLKSEVKDEIWDLATKRLIKSASGNVTAFVDGADERSAFVRIELPLILDNRDIKTINGEDKIVFAKRFE